jgi:hypothetical protein
MNIITRKIGKNRGRARLWIEGKSLLSEGWRVGRRFNIEFGAKIVLTADPDGKRKIAGTATRPIIDTNTDKLEAFAPSVKIYIDSDTITITTNTEI